MFDIAWTEMLVIAVITILVVGPKDLPKVMRGIGNIMGKARGFADKFRSDIDALARETEMEDLRKQARAYQDRFRQQQMALEQDFLDPTTGARRPSGKDGAAAPSSADAGASQPAASEPASADPVTSKPAAPDSASGESGNG